MGKREFVPFYQWANLIYRDKRLTGFELGKAKELVNGINSTVWSADTKRMAFVKAEIAVLWGRRNRLKVFASCAKEIPCKYCKAMRMFNLK